MNIPYSLLIYLPKSIQDSEIKKRWAQKPDNAILNSFDDATAWIDISLGIFSSDTTKSIAQDCFMRLDKYILPEMRERNLFIHDKMAN